MELDEFLQLTKFASLSAPDQVKHLAWFLDRQKGAIGFDISSIRACYSSARVREPQIGREITRLAARGEVLLGDDLMYHLEHGERKVLDEKYGDLPQTIAISQLLQLLPGKISNQTEKTFLDEVLKCYRSEAFRASTVMTWNLAYDHLLSWILSNQKRLAEFNSALPARVGPKRAGSTMRQREDFDELKESEVLDIASGAKLVDKGMKQVLEIGLTRRNQAAHPSSVTISRATAEDMIDSLVTNVVLRLN